MPKRCAFGCPPSANKIHEKHKVSCEKYLKPDEEIVAQSHPKRNSDYDCYHHAKKLKSNTYNDFKDKCDNCPLQYKVDTDEIISNNGSLQYENEIVDEIITENNSESNSLQYDIESCENITHTSKEELDDCLIYGKLLTKKLRTYSKYERYLIMYKINKLLIVNPPGFDTAKTDSSTASKLKNGCLKLKNPLESQIEASVSPISDTNYPIPLVNATKSIPNQRDKLTTSIPNSVNVHSKQNIVRGAPNQPANVSTNLNLSMKAKNVCQNSDQVVSVPIHIPLEITIPENKLATAMLRPSTYTKDKIIRIESSKCVNSPQPPILITVASLSEVVPQHSTQYSIYSLEKFESSIDKVNETDLNTVSHEVVVSESGDSQTIVEYAQ